MRTLSRNAFRMSTVPGSQRHVMTGQALFITFDAFSTLFHPRRPVPELYASVAQSFGFTGPKLTAVRLQDAFKTAFKAQSKAYPNYGRDEVLRGQYGGPRQWWGDLIKTTFAKALDDESVTLPNGMVEKLLDTFASEEGYALFNDVDPFFKYLNRLKTTKSAFDYIITGVISNSDDRVPVVLKSLGLSVGNVRADRDRSSTELPGFEEIRAEDVQQSKPEENDVDIVITSYEAGQEKPHRLIYDVATRQAKDFLCTTTAPYITDSLNWTRIHVGDDLQKDYIGSKNAGWHSILLARDEHASDLPKDINTVNSLIQVITEIEKHAKTSQT